MRMAFVLMVISVGVFGFLFGIAWGTMVEAKTEAEEIEQTYNTYSDCGVIMYEPDEWVDVVFQNGHVFAFKNVDGDWCVGDLVTVTFDDNGTEKIVDDIIVGHPRYSGWISEDEMENWIK